jgi:hypothetical protein
MRRKSNKAVSDGAGIDDLNALPTLRAGVDRAGLRALLFKYARIAARKFEPNLVPGCRTLLELNAAGLASDQFALSKSPDRLVPIVEKADDTLIVASGDPFRSNACVFSSNGMHGLPTSREIRRRP